MAEGIIYCYDFYNGVATGETYVLRLVSCVALHAVWAAAAAIAVYRRSSRVDVEDWGDFAISVLWVLAVPMTLHGLYDTLLKKEMPGWALLAALASFAWLAVLMEWTAHDERAEAIAAFENLEE